MEKKVRYLMLLLCLCLFPFRVYALESEIPINENNNQSDVVVESINDLNNNQEMNSSNEEEEENDNVADEELVALNATNDDDTDTDANSKKVVTAPVVGSETPGEENPDENNTTLVGESVNVLENDNVAGNSATVIDSVAITNVNFELWSGEQFTFTATNPEPENYTLVSERWTLSGNLVATSTGINSTVELNNYYEYSFDVQLPVGCTYASHVETDEDYIYSYYEMSVNGVQHQGYATLTNAEENIYTVYPYIYIQPLNSNYTYVDSIEIQNVMLDAFVGQGPFYGATTNNEHFHVWTEAWEYYDAVDTDEDGTPIIGSIYNISNPKINDENIHRFSTFEAGKTYYYMILVTADEGYGIKNISNSSWYYGSYNLVMNGTQQSVHGYAYENEMENGAMTYYFALDSGINPIEVSTYEVTENANPTITEGQAPDVAITIGGDFSTFENVYLNGSLVEETNYEKSGSEESTKITLLSSFLNTLAQGVHNLAFYFKNGKIAFTDLTVNAPETTTTTTTNNTSTSSQEAVYATIETTETVEETKLEVKKDTKDTKDNKKDTEEDDDDDEKENSNTGLIIFLVILIVIAVAIPVTIYRKKQ